jgi:hypothetical protein
MKFVLSIPSHTLKSETLYDWRKGRTRFSHTHLSIEINITAFAVSYAVIGDICQVWRHLKQGSEPIEDL